MSTYVPFGCFIQAIQLGSPTTVTFTGSSDFSVGEVVSFRVSPISGTRELNNQQPTITSVTTVTNTNDTITVPINSLNYTPFVYYSENEIAVPAMVVPSSSGIVPGAIPPQTNLQDVFDNQPLT